LLLHQALEEAITLWLNASPAVLESDVEVNNRVYESMKEELANSHSGKFAVIAEGRMLGVFGDLKEVSEALRALRPRVRHAIVTKVGVDGELAGEFEWWGGSIERLPAEST